MKAICAWGFGADVLVEIDGTTVVLYEEPANKDRYRHGSVTRGSLDLTADEAEDLANQLQLAAKAARDLDNSYVQSMMKEVPDDKSGKSV